MVCVDAVDSCVDSEAKSIVKTLHDPCLSSPCIGFPRLEVHLSQSAQDRLDIVKYALKLN